jgi:RNA polymerase sigma-70 factor (ECF subfamily)
VDFADLYSRYALDVFRFAYYLSGSRELAEDIAAETFARALTVNDEVKPGSIKAYLLAVARNLFVDWTRRRERTNVSIDDHLSVADPMPGPEQIASDRLQLDAARIALLRLPEPERAVLLMATLHELPYDEIAAAVGCSRAAVKVRIHRARLRLRASLTEERKLS